MGLPVLDTVLNIIKTPLERLVPDQVMRDKFAHEIQVAALKAGLDQMEINKIEAAHRTIFVAGWRPFIGWVCGLALAWHFIIYDILAWVRVFYFPEAPELPSLGGAETLVTVLLSMLGLGGLRTVEKIKGITR